MSVEFNTSAIEKSDIVITDFNQIVNYDPIAELSFLPQIAVVEGKHVGREQVVESSSNSYVGVAVSDCALPDATFDITTTERWIDPKVIGGQLFVCGGDFDKTFGPFRNEIKNAIDYYVAKGVSPTIALIVSYLDKQIQKSLVRLSMYGDKAITASGASAYGLKSADNIPFYNQVDGVFKQYNVAIAANKVSNCDPKDFTTALDLLDELWNISDPYLRSLTGQKYAVDRWTFNKVLKEVKALNTISEQSIVNGLPTVKFNGKTVFSLEAIELYEKDFEVNSTTHAAFQPTKAMLFVPDNHVIATTNVADFKQINVYDEKNYVVQDPISLKNTRKRGVVIDFTYSADMFIRTMKMASVAFGKASWAK